MILARKIIKIPEFLYLPEKFTKCPNFYMIFPEKCPDFTYYLPEKYFSVILGGGHVPPFPPSPTPMTEVNGLAFSYPRSKLNVRVDADA